MGASAMWMEQVARNWLTWEMTGSAFQLGAVNFARAIPSILAGLFAGVMADRVSKKRLLVVAQTWSFIVYAAMAWIVLSGNLQLWHLYASTMALALGMSVSQPVRSAYVPALVPQHQVIGALSLNATAMNGSRVLWPAIAGILIASINPGYAYVVSVGFYVLLQWTTLQVHNADAPDPEAQRGSVGGDLAAGFKFVWNEKLLLALLLSRFGPVTLASGFQVLIPVFAVTVLGMGAGAYGALLSAEGLGAIIGGFTIASRKRIARPGLIALIAGSALGILLVLALFVSVFWVFCLLLVLSSLASPRLRSSPPTTAPCSTARHPTCAGAWSASATNRVPSCPSPTWAPAPSPKSSASSQPSPSSAPPASPSSGPSTSGGPTSVWFSRLGQERATPVVGAARRQASFDLRTLRSGFPRSPFS